MDKLSSTNPSLSPRGHRLFRGLVALSALAAGITAAAGTTYQLEADSFPHILNLNVDDIVEFTLQNGQTRHLQLKSYGAKVDSDFGQKQWVIWAQMEVDT